MNYSPRAHPEPDGMNEHPETRTVGGLVAFAAMIPLTLALLSAPAVVMAAALGAAVVSVLLRTLEYLGRADGPGVGSTANPRAS